MEKLKKVNNFKKYYLYFTIFITGAAVLVIEILGTRILAPFYGSTIFVWASLIAVTLGFLSLGYWLGGRLADKSPSTRVFYLLVFLSGFSVFILYSLKPIFIGWSDGLGLKYGPLMAAALFFGVPFTIFGALSPFVIRLLTTSVSGSGKSAGSVFAMGTVGSLAGALVGGFYAIPIFSIQTIIYALVILTSSIALIGAILVHPKSASSKSERWTLSLLLLLTVALISVLFFRGPLVKAAIIEAPIFVQETLYENNNFYGYNKLIGQPRALDGQLCFLIDSTVQGCIDKNEDYEYSYAPLAAVADTLQPDSRFLMLGLGLGEYFYYFPPTDLQVDVVDINPATFTATEKTIEVLQQYNDPRAVMTDYQSHTEDARAFLRDSNEQYDLIFTDLLSNVVFPDYVFTQEAFSLVQERLADDGSFVMSVVGKTNGEDRVVNAVIATLQSVFPYVYIFSEHPDHFFEYNLIMARTQEIDLKPINQFIDGIIGDDSADLQAMSSRDGLIVTDEHNPLWIWWTENLITNTESVNDLRLKFKRLSLDDFYE